MFAPFAKKANHAGLTLAFENCGVYTQDVFAVLDELGIPDWGLAWDIHNEWHASSDRQKNEEEYVSNMTKRSRIVHVKAAGAVTGEKTPIPYDRVLAVINDSGFNGPITIETHNADPKTSHIDQSLKILELLNASWPQKL